LGDKAHDVHSKDGRIGFVHLEEKTEETLLLSTTTSSEDASKMEPDSSQKCTAIEQEAIDTS